MGGPKAIAAAVIVAALGACSMLPDDYRPLAGRPPGGSHLLVGGTGFLLPGGYVLTARHVTSDCKAIRATARSGAFEAAPATIAAIPSNPLMDLSLLRLDPVIPGVTRGARLRDLWSDSTAPGAAASPWPKLDEPLVVLGYPGATTSMEPAAAPLSQVLAARLTNNVWHGDAFAVFGDINPGDSGGPMVDRSGRVVGVVFAVAFRGDELRKQGLNGSVGFALRARDIAAFLGEAGLPPTIDGADARADGSVDRFRDHMVRVFCFR
jgi:hypothetical protein